MNTYTWTYKARKELNKSKKALQQEQIKNWFREKSVQKPYYIDDIYVGIDWSQAYQNYQGSLCASPVRQGRDHLADAVAYNHYTMVGDFQRARQIAPTNGPF